MIINLDRKSMELRLHNEILHLRGVCPEQQQNKSQTLVEVVVVVAADDSAGTDESDEMMNLPRVGE